VLHVSLVFAFAYGSGVVVAASVVGGCGGLSRACCDCLKRLAVGVALAFALDHVSLRVVGVALLIAVVAAVVRELIFHVVGISVGVVRNRLLREVAVYRKYSFLP